MRPWGLGAWPLGVEFRGMGCLLTGNLAAEGVGC